MDLRLLASYDCGFESRRGYGCLSLVSVLRCQVEGVSANGRSLIQRNPTESGVSECDLESKTVRTPRPARTIDPYRLSFMVYYWFLTYLTTPEWWIWPKNLKLYGNSRDRFIGSFTKVRKATLRCVIFVCLSVRPSIYQSAWNKSVPIGPIFNKILYFSIFSKTWSENLIFTTIWDEYVVLYMKTDTYLWQYHA
jgi:hypothetical protein